MKTRSASPAASEPHAVPPTAPVYCNAADLLSWLRPRASNSPFHVVSIEGAGTAGISSLALALARELGCAAIDCGDHVDRPGEQPSDLDVNRLRRAVVGALDPHHPVIVHGRHVRRMLHAAALRVSSRIYVRPQRTVAGDAGATQVEPAHAYYDAVHAT
jgi:hypothetical protein